jgi:hypothetical protein
MKKLLYFIIIIVLAGVGLLYINTAHVVWKTPVTVSTPTAKTATVTVSIMNGSKPVTAEGIQAATAYDALVSMAAKLKFLIKTKKYEFGIFVEQIGTYPNAKDKAWIYYVNGKSGTVAADKETLQSGDTVEWKYEKPMYE